MGLGAVKKSDKDHGHVDILVLRGAETCPVPTDAVGISIGIVGIKWQRIWPRVHLKDREVDLGSRRIPYVPLA